MGKYRKKTVVEAEQWSGTFEDKERIEKIFSRLKTMAFDYNLDSKVVYGWVIKSVEGICFVFPGNFIVQISENKYYTCKPDIFAATYEEVKDFVKT